LAQSGAVEWDAAILSQLRPKSTPDAEDLEAARKFGEAFATAVLGGSSLAHAPYCDGKGTRPETDADSTV